VSSEKTLRIHVDGASRGNPGDAGFGVHVAEPDGTTVAELYGHLGSATNNVAEYQGLLHALRWARDRGVQRLEIYSDSELLVRQMGGRYRVKNPKLQPLYREAAELVARFERVSLQHVPREQNRKADALANRALDEHASRLE
jgi:ribonuclease HI